MTPLSPDEVRVGPPLALAAAITFDQTTLDVLGDASSWPDSDFQIKIEDELILVGTRSDNTFSDLTRGHEGTDDTHHGKNVEVAYVKSGVELADAGPGGSFDGGTVHHTITIDPDGSDEPALKIGESTEPPDDGASAQLFTDPGDGKLKVKLPDNSVAEVGGGGSMPYQAFANGIFKDYAIPDGASAALLDPTAQAWLSDHEYSVGELQLGLTGVPSYVHPSSSDAVKFKSIKPQHGLTGTDEPEWVLDGSPFGDGELVWGAYTAAPFIAAGWQADHLFEQCVIVADGIVFIGSGGTSGSEEPDWSTAPDYNDTVVDNEITWQHQGPVSVWSAETEFRFNIKQDNSDYYSDWVLPTVDNGNAFSLISINRRYVSAGETEPEWDDVAPGDGTYWTDGEVCWEEATSDSEVLVLTGIEAPSSAALLTVVNAAPPGSSVTLMLEDQAEVDSDYGADVESDEGNRFNAGDENIEVDACKQISVAYANGQWQPLGTT